jgi:leucyl aminopeptidase
MKINFVSSEKDLKEKETAIVELTEEKDVRIIETDKQRIVRLGIGKRKEMNHRKLITAARRIVATAKEHKIKRVALRFRDLATVKNKTEHISTEDLAQLLAENFEMANYEFTQYKKEPEEGWKEVEEVIVIGADSKSIQKAFEKGKIIGEEVNRCRDLANTPGGNMTPKLLAQKARDIAKNTKIKTIILGKRDMERLKMGAVLGVAQGSSEEPQFIILEYKGGVREKPIVFVGKGVTFDTGGLNLKPEQGISEMHMDKSGGAAVIHTVALAARLKLKKNLVGLIPAVENMPSGSSFRPGDILCSMSGKTIEIINTDAEGRVILADALTYANRYKPRLVVDVATLTGASLVALGQIASALQTPNQKLEKLLMELGENSGEYLWPFPLWEEYQELVKGNFGDIANLPTTGNTRWAGVIAGGMFLYQFAKDYPWAHIDIAPRMTSTKNDYLAKGATGSPLRLLYKIAETY